MSEEQLIQTIADSAPIADEEVAALDLERVEAELLDAIVKRPVVEDRPPRWVVRRAALKQRRFVIRAGAALAGVAAAAALIVSGNEPGGDGDADLAYAAEWIRIAENNPRLLVTAPGWKVTRVDEYQRDNGEMTFSDGKNELDVFWRPAAEYEDDVHDPSYAKPNRDISLLGETATLIRYAGTTDFIVLLPPEDETYLEIRGDLGSEEAYLEIVRSLERTDVETWLAALPPSVVQPLDRAAAVDEMLEGIPVPPRFDVASLRRGETVRDRYQLGALVTGAVTCAWLDRWAAGIENGDAAKVKEARKALATARGWPILLEMQPEGGWSEVLWDFAEDGLGSSGFGPNTSQAYRPALGCPAR